MNDGDEAQGAQQQRDSQPQISGLNSPIWFGVLIAIGVTLLFQLGGLAISDRVGDDNPLLARLLFAATQLGLMLVPTLLIARSQPVPYRELLRLRPVSWVHGAGALVGTLLLWQVLQSYLLFQDLYLIPDGWMTLYESQQKSLEKTYIRMFSWNDVVGLAASLLAGSFVPALTEELLFRGLAQRSFERVLYPSVAIVLAAVVFATLHFQPTTFVALIILGCWFGFLVVKTGSIIPAILGHFIFNSISIIALYDAGDGTLENLPHTTAELLATLPLSALSLALFVPIIIWLGRRGSLEPTTSES
jgi:membrane protease YdiL (CAAX protease family)